MSVERKHKDKLKKVEVLENQYGTEGGSLCIVSYQPESTKGWTP